MNEITCKVIYWDCKQHMSLNTIFSIVLSQIDLVFDYGMEYC